MRESIAAAYSTASGRRIESPPLAATASRRRLVGGTTEPERRRQGHGLRPDGVGGGLAALKVDAAHWHSGPEYEALPADYPSRTAQSLTVELCRSPNSVLR